MEITPDTVQLLVGGTRGLHAIPRTADGREVQGRDRHWRSSDESIARVDLSGSVTALREGTVTIVAVVDGREGSARMVESPPPGPPPVPSAGTERDRRLQAASPAGLAGAEPAVGGEVV